MLLHLFLTLQIKPKTILLDNRIKKSNFEFTYNFGKVLVLPAIRRRCEKSNGFQIKIVKKMRQSLGIKEVLGCPEPDNFVRKHWKMIQVCGVYCWNSTLKNLKNLKNKLKTKCSKCLKFICRQYQAEVQFVCADCKKGNIFSRIENFGNKFNCNYSLIVIFPLY